jgi:hypothetical protein
MKNPDYGPMTDSDHHRLTAVLDEIIEAVAITCPENMERIRTTFANFCRRQDPRL